MHYEGIVIRPPSEAGSIILQVTVGCSHNRCTFCGAYKDVLYRLKNQSEIERDLVFASKHCPGQKKVFLADGDVLNLPLSFLEDLFIKIRRYLPHVRRISLYGNGTSINRKSIPELSRLKELGLDRIYLGIESGDDAVLEKTMKGESVQTLTEAGEKVTRAGIFLSTTVLLGIGGANACESQRHARLTAALLNRVQPRQIAVLTLMVLNNTPLAEQVKNKTFQLPDAHFCLQELHTMITDLQVERVQFMANHSSNYLPLSGRLNRDKHRILTQIDQAIDGNNGLVPEGLRAL